MMKKFVFILGLLCCYVSSAVASENLIENLKALSNTVVVDGVVSQQAADPFGHGNWKVQAIYNNLKHSRFGDTQSYEALIFVVDDKTGFVSTKFTTPGDLENLAYIRFGTNGTYTDTVVQFDIKDIMPNTTYTLQWRVLNNIQGEVSWNDMRVVRCQDGYSLELGEETCSRVCENKSVTGGHIPPNAELVYEPTVCTYDQMRVECDDGYGLHDGECVPLCAVDMRYIKTSNGLQFNLYPVAYSTPALHVKRNGTVCHAVLAPGAAKNSININHNGQIYHTVD